VSIWLRLRGLARPLAYAVSRQIHYANLRGREYDRAVRPQIEIGRHSYGVRTESVVLPTGRERLVVGNYCSIATGVRFVFGGHPTDLVSTFPLRTILTKPGANLDALDGEIIIGHDVWIGANALIMPGATIGNGVIVAAGAVVTSDVAPYSIVGGVPARHIRYRFDQGTIDALQRIAWWNWPDAVILGRLAEFYGSVPEFIARYEQQ
jgi:acetyltransferase-like isoleucine patch superfamily enzyme